MNKQIVDKKSDGVELWLKRKGLKPIHLALIIVVIGYLIYISFINLDNYISVKNNYNIAFGKIIKYSEFGIGSNKYLTYTFFVDNKWYTRTINPSKSFIECYDDINLCADKLFFVIYSPKNPDKSMIDLINVLESPDRTKFPKNLDNFE